jgi:hypothetical protein
MQTEFDKDMIEDLEQYYRKINKDLDRLIEIKDKTPEQNKEFDKLCIINDALSPFFKVFIPKLPGDKQ